MSHYYGINRTDEYYLMHYGVKGMKWGVLKAVDEVASKRSPTYNNAKRKLKELTNTVKVNTGIRKGEWDTTGRYGKGNINLNRRRVVHNKDGSISTERSFSTNIDGKETLLPTVVRGRVVSEDEAIDHYLRTGEHLGRFDTVKEADDYAEKLHERQDRYYNDYLPSIRNKGKLKKIRKGIGDLMAK